MKFRILILLFSIPLLASSGPWTRVKNSSYSQLSYTYLSYSQLLNGSDEKIGLKRTIYDHTIQFYDEYGITDRFNVIINLPYKIVYSSADINDVSNDPYSNDTLEQGWLSGFSNLYLAGKFMLMNRKYVLSAQVAVQNEMSQYDAASGMRIGYEAWLLTPSVLFGRGWNKSWLQTELGAQLNSADYAQNFIGNFEYGYKINRDRTYLMFRIDAKIPVTEGSHFEGTSVQTGLYRDNSSYISPGLKLTQKLGKNWYLNLAGYGAFYSVNEGANATLNAGLACEW